MRFDRFVPKRFLLPLAGVLGLVGLAVAATNIVSRSADPVTARARRAFGALSPEISPDGQTIAFSFQGAIWRMPRTGGVMRRLTSSAGFDENPSWSPDGSQLTYVNSSTGEVRVIDAASGRLLQTVPEVL